MSKPRHDPGAPLDADVGTDKLPRGGFVGQSVRRFEDARLLTGLGRYVDDRPAGNALHLAILRSDQAHARIRAIRTDAARAMDGVFGIYSWADLAGLVKPAFAVSRMAG